ncbi:MAG: hypothetical protein KA744_16435, partial [Phenylobacterium sp.]|nr:hypothetical protein [Phenylobacterium sp.]
GFGTEGFDRDQGRQSVAVSNGVKPISGSEFLAMAQPTRSSPPPLLAATAVLAASALVTGVIAAVHMWLTALRGPMCGPSDGHCWACYVAPLLAMSALTAWHAHRGRFTLVRARTR